MANRLNMAKIQAIEQPQALKWSQRKIARELGIDRGAVARHLRRLETDPKAAIPPAGSSDPKAATFPPSPGTFSIRADQAGCAASDSDSKAAIPPTGSASMAETNSAAQTPSNAASPETSASVSPAGRRSQCETYREIIQAKLDQQLSAQRIWQDLVADQGFAGKYDSVKRFVRVLSASMQNLPAGEIGGRGAAMVRGRGGLTPDRARRRAAAARGPAGHDRPRRDVQQVPLTSRSTRGAWRRDRAGQLRATQGEAAHACSPGGPRPASGTPVVGITCSR